MKIGIITLPLHTNYGGILQAYALQTILERMGHNVVIIDTPNKKSILKWNYLLILLKRCVAKFLFHKPIHIFYEQWYNKNYPIISKYTQPFINKYINRFEISHLHKLSQDSFDVLIVGSDQVWRPMYFTFMYQTCIEDAFLEFAKDWNIRRIAYAASFGTDDWEYSKEQTKECSKLLSMFDAISTREKTGVELCRHHLGVKSTQVLDPTMLLSRNDYINLFNLSSIPHSDGNMLCYILDETKNKKEIIDFIAKEKNFKPFKVNSKVGDYTITLEERIQPPVETWLRGFYDADFVVTDSFHACVFSILFEKPFVVIGNKERGLARFHSLLSTFELQECFVTECDSIKLLNIDWSKVSSILVAKRHEALSFLQDALI